MLKCICHQNQNEMQLILYILFLGDESCPQNTAIAEIQEYLPKFYNLFTQYGNQLEYYFSSKGKNFPTTIYNQSIEFKL